ncbi:MAG: glycogen-binding domain-containing protein [Elusimicrobiota bacterium]|nr:MAG: glycogen-binding domain-containing protein [Elusimicrobiota bacterium]
MDVLGDGRGGPRPDQRAVDRVDFRARRVPLLPVRLAARAAAAHDDELHPRDGRRDAPLVAVEFRHRAPKAKSVELVGDFNAWKPGLLRMTRGGDGVWTLSLPVVEGRHKYLFLVDGDPKVDEKADTADGPEGRRVSVRTVK